MSKLRDARYCNLKLFLIFLVIYGHFIEPGIGASAFLMAQYKIIYFFHMPAFCFVTGLFMKSEKACRSMMGRMLLLYLLLQLPTVIFNWGGTVLWRPTWVLWYLLSCSIWAAAAWLWYRFFKGKGRLLILLISVAGACAAGCFEFIGRDFSLSRSIVFFPYFWMGLMVRPDYTWQRLRPYALPGLCGAVLLMAVLWKGLPVSFLYQADPFAPAENGFILRLACFAVGTLVTLFLLCYIPAVKLPVSRFGADTLWPYLIHWPVATLLKSFILPWPVSLLLAAVIIALSFFVGRLTGKSFEIVDSRDLKEDNKILA